MVPLAPSQELKNAEAAARELTRMLKMWKEEIDRCFNHLLTQTFLRLFAEIGTFSEFCFFAFAAFWVKMSTVRLSKQFSRLSRFEKFWKAKEKRSVLKKQSLPCLWAKHPQSNRQVSPSSEVNHQTRTQLDDFNILQPKLWNWTEESQKFKTFQNLWSFEDIFLWMVFEHWAS